MIEAMKQIFIFIIVSILLCGYACAQESTQLDSAIHKYLDTNSAEKLPNFRSGFTDLNNDGVKDAIVIFQDSQFCGSGGCTLLVFQGVNNSFKLISESTISNTPIRVSKTKNNGWRNIILFSGGTGTVVLIFNGKTYPSNPSLQKLVSEFEFNNSEIVIANPPHIEKLITENYEITITDNCQGELGGCTAVSYDGMNIKSGKAIHLKGEKTYELCDDGKTKYKLNGYKFINRNTEYFVSLSGELRVTQNKSNVLLIENGTWK